MQSDHLYVQGDLTAIVTVLSRRMQRTLMVFYFILRQLGANCKEILEKVPVSLFLVWHAPFVAAKYSWFFAFPLEVSFYCYFTCFRYIWFFVFRNCFGYRFVTSLVLPLCYTASLHIVQFLQGFKASM